MPAPRGPILCVLLVATAMPAAAQFGPPAPPCPTGTAQTWLRGGNVEAALFTNGNLFYSGSLAAAYLVPSNGTRSTSALYASSLWLGGLVGGEVRTAAARYNGFTFRPGRTGPDGVPPDSTACAGADRMWTLAQMWDDTDPAAIADILEWPAHLGAPVVDGDGDPSNYDLAAGDRPALRGDRTAFWAMTDVAAARGPDGGLPLGVDVTVEASSFLRGTLGATTFYHYTITNRNPVPIEDAYVGFWSDPDLGGGADDYAGTDTTAHMAFVYNSDDDDVAYGVPPALGVVVAGGAAADANGRDDDRDGEVDEPGEEIGLTSAAILLKSATGAYGEPVEPSGYYNRLRGLLSDGSPFYEYGFGGDREGGGADRTVFAYPGDAVTGAFWSNENADGSGARSSAGLDVRMLASAGPFRLMPGASTEVTFAVVFAQGEDRLDSVTRLRGVARVARRAVEGGALDPTALRRVPDSTPPEVPVSFRRPHPNPFTDVASVIVRGADATITVYDMLGRRVAGPEAVGPSGTSTVEVGRGLAPGVYLVRVAGFAFEEAFTVTKAR